MKASLHQDLVPAELDGFSDLLEQLLAIKHVSLGALRRPVKRTKVANRSADVCVVDIPIDVVGAIALRMQSIRNGKGSLADRAQIRTLQERQSLLACDPLTGGRFIKDRLNRFDR